MAYVAEASARLSTAFQLENVLDFSGAVHAYIDAIGILLRGAPTDLDERRRSHVQKKVLDYIRHAEALKKMIPPPPQHPHVPKDDGRRLTFTVEPAVTPDPSPDPISSPQMIAASQACLGTLSFPASLWRHRHRQVATGEARGADATTQFCATYRH